MSKESKKSTKETMNEEMVKIAAQAVQNMPGILGKFLDKNGERDNKIIACNQKYSEDVQKIMKDGSMTKEEKEYTIEQIKESKNQTMRLVEENIKAENSNVNNALLLVGGIALGVMGVKVAPTVLTDKNVISFPVKKAV